MRDGLALLTVVSQEGARMFSTEDADAARIRVVIADDNTAVRDALADAVAADAGCQLVGVAADGQGAIALAGAWSAHVAVLDLKMPSGGEAAITELRRRSPTTRVLVFSAYADAASAASALAAGASEVIAKGSSSTALVEAVRRVARQTSAHPADGA